MWDGRLLSHHLLKVYGIKLGVRQSQRLFKKLGFRRRKPRPVIAKADGNAQMEFKKTQKIGSSK
jgi:transposase